uniref:Tocopherol cyclase n=1 Tax=Tetradesmus obliquus TaxID=3088 RepID=A0A383VS04_TETOB|eukprot:jgi/Sobl393_1/6142/SZX67524.1
MQLSRAGWCPRHHTALHPARHARAVPAAATSNVPAVLTPHSGYHWDGLPRRFFEGWYFKVTIPENGQSFALIYSIEDPSNPSSPVGGVGVQVMGPDDGYICQFSRDTEPFWASRHNLELGATLKPKPTAAGQRQLRRPVPQAEFSAAVEQGFQASPTWHQGSIVAAETGTPGPPLSTVADCSWAFSMTPKVGWGDAPAAAVSSNLNATAAGAGWGSGSAAGERQQQGNALAAMLGGRSQRATAGWLSMLAVFEPHWQVLMAEGSATGWMEWGGKRYEFSDAPGYAEKNWGGGFPSKWIWVQCNTFDTPGLSVTAVGARRQLLLGVQGVEEDVGMLGIHLPDGTFLELVPWAGEVEWSADPWGRWWLRGRAAGYEAVLEATCGADDGAVLRAPTADNGLAPHCKDTFFGKCRLRVWKLDSQGRVPASAAPIVDSQSSTAALEVGGGPWWGPWSAKAKMLEPFRSLVQLPIDVGVISRTLPDLLKPPGL